MLGVVALEKEDEKLYKDGHSYNILDIAMNNERDLTTENEENSPEDLLEMEIWHIPR